MTSAWQDFVSGLLYVIIRADGPPFDIQNMWDIAKENFCQANSDHKMSSTKRTFFKFWPPSWMEISRPDAELDALWYILSQETKVGMVTESSFLSFLCPNFGPNWGEWPAYVHAPGPTCYPSICCTLQSHVSMVSK